MAFKVRGGWKEGNDALVLAITSDDDEKIIIICILKKLLNHFGHGGSPNVDYHYLRVSKRIKKL